MTTPPAGIDVVILPIVSTEKETMITFKVANALPPLSAEEARRGLGL